MLSAGQSPCTAQHVTHKMPCVPCRLILSKPSLMNVDFVQLTLNAYGVPFDLVTIGGTTPASAIATPAFWTAADGAGKYSAIFMAQDMET